MFNDLLLVKRTPRINKVFFVVVCLKLYILFKTMCIHIYEQQLPGSSQVLTHIRHRAGADGREDLMH